MILSDRFMRFYIITIAVIMSIGVCWGMLTILRVFPPAPSFHKLTVFELQLADSGRTTIILTRGSGFYHLRGNFSAIFRSGNTYELKLLVWDWPQTRDCYVLEVWDVTDPDNELHWDFSGHDFGVTPNPPYKEPL